MAKNWSKFLLFVLVLVQLGLSYRQQEVFPFFNFGMFSQVQEANQNHHKPWSIKLCSGGEIINLAWWEDKNWWQSQWHYLFQLKRSNWQDPLDPLFQSKLGPNRHKVLSHTNFDTQTYALWLRKRLALSPSQTLCFCVLSQAQALELFCLE